MSDPVTRSRELDAMRELQDAHLALLRAEKKLAKLGHYVSSRSVERVRQKLEREGSLIRGALGLDEQLRRRPA